MACHLTKPVEELVSRLDDKRIEQLEDSNAELQRGCQGLGV